MLELDFVQCEDLVQGERENAMQLFVTKVVSDHCSEPIYELHSRRPQSEG